MNIIKILNLLHAHTNPKIAKFSFFDVQLSQSTLSLTSENLNSQQKKSFHVIFASSCIHKTIAALIKPGGFFATTTTCNMENFTAVHFEKSSVLRKKLEDKETSFTLSIRGALTWGNMLLSFSEDNLLETQILLSFVMKVEISHLYIFPEKKLSLEEDNTFSVLLQMRRERYPISYITKERGFMSLSFAVSSDVLIPRPETELLVEYVCDVFCGKKIQGLDLATGSGCIAISILHYLPKAIFMASDISINALKVANKNAHRNEVKKRISFVNGDMLAPFAKNMQFDLIVTNPPYISEEQYKTLAPEVKYEPKLALTAKNDGYYFYQKILREVGCYLDTEGMLIMELGYGQAKNLQIPTCLKVHEIIKDYAGIERFIVVTKNLAI